MPDIAEPNVETADEIRRLSNAYMFATHRAQHYEAEVARLQAFICDVSATRDTAVNMHLEDVAKIGRLTAALQPFAEAYDALMQQDEAFPRYHSIDTAQLREARRALEFFKP